MKTKYHSVVSVRAGQCDRVTPNNTSRLRFAALGFGGLFFITICSLSPTPAEAQCRDWNVSGGWVVQQSNRFSVSVNLTQEGKTVFGTARYNGKGKGDLSGAIGDVNPIGGKVVGAIEPDKNVTYNGEVTGNIDGDGVYFSIEWGNNTTGVYRGKIGPQGKIEGSTYHKQIPKNKATWSSDRVMKCQDVRPIGRTGKAPVPAPPAAPGRGPIKRTGKAPTANPPVVTKDVNDPNARGPIADAARAAEAASQASRAAEDKAQSSVSGAARITASPTDATGGSTTLTWDGGPQHPYAEVWVGVDGEDPTFVVEQGQGSRRVTVEPGKTYRYILTDSGKELSTVTVRGR